MSAHLSKCKILFDVEEASVVGLQLDLQKVFWGLLRVNKQKDYEAGNKETEKIGQTSVLQTEQTQRGHCKSCDYI